MKKEKKKMFSFVIFFSWFIFTGCMSFNAGTSKQTTVKLDYEIIREYDSVNLQQFYGEYNMEKYLLKYNSVEQKSDKSSLKKLEDFPISQVKLLDKNYLDIIQKDVDFLNTFNPDKLLYNFRLTAGFTKEELAEGKFDYNSDGKIEAESYSGWENSRIGGHTLGHYLTAAAQAIACGYGDCKGKDGISLLERHTYIINALEECQKKNDSLTAENPSRKKGFIFGATMADPLQPELQFDKVESTNASDTWVPWYTLHKIINGLVESYKLAENKKALEIAENLGEWIYERTALWTEEVQDRVLRIEYGGMNDCLYEVYKCSKSNNSPKAEHILTAAHKFDEEKLFNYINTSAKGAVDTLNNHHANCTIPKYMGALNRYRTLSAENKDTGDYLEYVENFWELVVKHHSYITGGNSECEHFGKDNILDAERSNTNNETCNTHNMLKITRELFKITGDRKYADYYENTFLNAIMASVNGESGMTAYFQPMASGCFKTYCNPDVDKNYFWCCTGTGLENFTKLGDSIYFHDENSLVINQFLSSQVEWKEKDAVITQKTNIPYENSAEITVNLKKEQDFSIYIRIPDWSKELPSLYINEKEISAPQENGYFCLKNQLHNGDRVKISIPMEITPYTLPDNCGKVFGFKYGPYVLAAELGRDKMMNIRQVGVLCDVSANKIIRGEVMALNGNYGGTSGLKPLSGETLVTNGIPVGDFMANIENHLVKLNDKDLKFSLKDTSWNGELIFSPYNKITDQRYGIYWLFSETTKSEEEILWENKNAARDSRVYIEGIGVGYGAQTEGNSTTYPCMEEKGEGSFGDPNDLTRYAKKDGSFSYLFQIDSQKKNFLVCGFLAEDEGKSICIKCGKTLITQFKLDFSKTEKAEKHLLKFEIPETCKKEAFIFEGKTVIRIEFSGINGEESARISSPAKTCTDYNHTAGIEKIEFITAQSEKLANGNYKVTVPAKASSATVKIQLKDKNGLLYINDRLVNEDKEIQLKLTGEQSVFGVKTCAEDFETFEEFSVLVVKG